MAKSKKEIRIAITGGIVLILAVIGAVFLIATSVKAIQNLMSHSSQNEELENTLKQPIRLCCFNPLFGQPF